MSCTSLGLESVEPEAGGCQGSDHLGKGGFVRILLSVCPLGHGAFSGKGGWETGSVGCFFPSYQVRAGLLSSCLTLLELGLFFTDLCTVLAHPLENWLFLKCPIMSGEETIGKENKGQFTCVVTTGRKSSLSCFVLGGATPPPPVDPTRDGFI